jgi:hypothetical protein
MILIRRQVQAFAVDRGRRSCDDLFYAGLNRRFEKIERARNVYFERKPGIILTKAQPSRSLMKNEIYPFNRRSHRFAISEVCFDYLDIAIGLRPGEMLHLAANEAIEHDYAGALSDEVIDDVRADQPRSTGHKNP